MDKLWAPWRMHYIKKAKSGGCFLCQAFKEHEDKKNYILARGVHCFVILNIYPYNSGHLMVVPNRHTAEFDDLLEEEVLELFNLIKGFKKRLAEVMHPEGFNIGFNLGRSAGAGLLDHVHGHVVPRWNGDTNFMPILGDAKVLPQALDDTYDLLKALK